MGPHEKMAEVFRRGLIMKNLLEEAVRRSFRKVPIQKPLRWDNGVLLEGSLPGLVLWEI